MLAKDIKVGGLYVAKVSGNITTVRVDAIRVGRGAKGNQTYYDVTNLCTKRTTTFRSAAKFRREATPVKVNDPPTGPGNSTTLPASEWIGDEGLTPPRARQHAVSGLASALASKLAPPDGKVAGYMPTPEQAAIIAACRQPGLKILVIEAGAGAGKTSTLKMLEEVLPGRGQYTAFNADLVAESKSKFRKASCNTTHSLAFRAVGHKYARRLNGARRRSSEIALALNLSSLMVDLGADPVDPEKRMEKVLDAQFLAGQVVMAVKRFCQSADREIEAKHFRYIDGIDARTDGKRGWTNNRKVHEHLLPYARAAWKDLSDPDGTLPFTHDCYVKVWQLGKPVIDANYILLDEDQDTAEVMVDVLKQQGHATMVLVGDENQSIYKWRGAVNATKAFPEADRLYLTQSFRFGQAIADVANTILGELEEPTNLRMRGLDGRLSRVVFDAAEGSSITPTCVLCRTNAGAVATVLQAIAGGKRPHLVGGGSEVVRFVEGALELQQGRRTSHPDLACFESWGEVEQYVSQDEGEDLKLMVKLIKEFGARNIIDALKHMPRQQDADLIVSTAHKSKGREWDVVKLAGDFQPTSKMGDEERRLLYVASTRAKRILDVSGCPPFVGKDDPIQVRFTEPQPTLAEVAADMEVAPALAPAPEPSAPQADPVPTTTIMPVSNDGTFSWAKGKDGSWLVRGPKGRKAGEQVEVRRRNGTSSRETVTKTIWEDEQVALYQV